MDLARSAPAQDPPARAAVLAAALRAFAAHGFEGASTRAIAAAARANQGLIRHHFGSKEGLWRELVERGLAALAADLERDGWTAVFAGHPHEPSDDGPAPALRGGAGSHLALLQLLLHALLEPGARRDWLVRAQLEPLRRRVLARQPQAGASPAMPPNDALLLAWLGSMLAPCVLASALTAATGRAVALDATLRAGASRGPWAHPARERPAGPWAPVAARGRHSREHAAGSTPGSAS